MCNLNIFIRKNKKDFDNLTTFLMGVTSASYRENRDGDGVFCDDMMVKSLEKVDFYKIKENIENSNIIISHQRKATSGFSKKWTQPFVNNDFVLVHNGVINDFLGNKGSDTWGFFLKFNKNFNNQSGTREEKIVKTIKKLLDKRDNGFYSIAILDRRTNNLYYFKDTNASIHFYLGKKSLYISTNEQNHVFLNMIDDSFEELIIDNYHIYKISMNPNILVSVIGDIKQEINYQEKKVFCKWFDNDGFWKDYTTEDYSEKNRINSGWGQVNYV